MTILSDNFLLHYYYEIFYLHTRAFDREPGVTECTLVGFLGEMSEFVLAEV